MADKEYEPIEIIEEVLDNQMALAMIVGGIVLGAILLYGYQEWAKSRASSLVTPRAPVALDPTDDRPEVVEIAPGWGG